jgi:16S rRNA G966 N2-methylase RsmD
VRIVGGFAKGRTLKTLRGFDIRPTPEKVRESVFQRLGDLEGKRFLDGFAGSGAMGIEALSRGASRVVFVENDKRACRCIEDNLKGTGFSKGQGWKTFPLVSKANYSSRGLMGKHEEDGRSWVLLPMAIIRAVPYFERTREVFDIIFLDPPYQREAGLVVLKRLVGSPLLHEQGRLIWEHSVGRQIELAVAAGWQVTDTRRFGETEVTELARVG